VFNICLVTFGWGPSSNVKAIFLSVAGLGGTGFAGFSFTAGGLANPFVSTEPASLSVVTNAQPFTFVSILTELFLRNTPISVLEELAISLTTKSAEPLTIIAFETGFTSACRLTKPARLPYFTKTKSAVADP